MIDETKFTERIKATLTASNELDSDTQLRLQAIRRKALLQTRKTAWWQSITQNMTWVPVAGVAFCSVMAIMLILPAQQSLLEPSGNTSDYSAMVELMESPDELDLVRDADFYLWLDEVQTNAANPADVVS